MAEESNDISVIKNVAILLTLNNRRKIMKHNSVKKVELKINKMKEKLIKIEEKMLKNVKKMIDLKKLKLTNRLMGTKDLTNKTILDYLDEGLSEFGDIKNSEKNKEIREMWEEEYTKIEDIIITEWDKNDGGFLINVRQVVIDIIGNQKCGNLSDY